jgi:hypothetical protein
MAILTQELLNGINAAFTDSAAWARAMQQLAAVEVLNRAKGKLAQGQALAATRAQATADALAAAQAAVDAAQAALDALAEAPDLGA